MKLYAILKNKSESVRLLLFLFIVLLFSFIGYTIAGFIFFEDFFSESSLNPDSIFRMKIAQLIISVFVFIISPLFLAYLEGGSILKRVGFSNIFNRQMILLILVIIFFIQPFISYTMQLNADFIMSLPDYFNQIKDYMSQMEESAMEITTAFLEMNTIGDFLFNLFLIALIPAIGEEMLFRGVLQQKIYLILRSPHLAIIISSCLFSIMHAQFFGFLPRFLLGILLGYLFYYSHNLWMPVLAHFTNNGLAVLLMYPPFAKRLNLDMNPENSEVSIIFGLLSVLSVLIMMYLYKQISEKQRKIN